MSDKIDWRAILRERLLNPRKYDLPADAIQFTFKIKETTQEEINACFAEIREILNEDHSGPR